MAEDRNYTIGKSRLKRACLYGLERGEDDRLILDRGDRHLVFFGRLNSMKEGTAWGRFQMRASLPEGSVLIVRAIAMDAEVLEDGGKIDGYLLDDGEDISGKLRFFEVSGCEKAVNAENVLLYRLKGQYLWLCVEILGAGGGEIGGLRVMNPGDRFMRTFPDIYQEEGGFFHRYMSIFSTIYSDLQQKIDTAYKYLDLDLAPVGLLRIYAGWLGLDIQGEILEEAALRRLLKSAYELNRIKGTRGAVEKLIRIMTGRDAVIVERNLLDDAVSGVKNVYDRLYGKGRQDVTVLIQGEAGEQLRAQLNWLIRQYRPVRSRIRLVFYGECSSMDTYCYMDINARLYQAPEAALDGGMRLGGAVLGD